MAVRNFSWVRFAPSALSLALGPGSGRARGLLSGGAVLNARRDLQAVGPGPMYSMPRAEGQATLVYAMRDRAQGIDLPSQYTSRGSTLWVDSAGECYVTQGGRVNARAVFAVQGYPTLLRDFSVWTRADGPDSDEVWRAALVHCGDGRCGIALAYGAMHDFSLELDSRDVAGAIYLDGSDSASLWVRGGARDGATAPRTLPAWVGVRGAVEGAAAGGLGPAVVTAGVLGLGGWALSRLLGRR